MSDSIRQQIITAVVTRLQGIKKTAGYKTALGLDVKHWRTIPFAESDLPSCSVRDHTAENEQETMKSMKNTISVDIEIKCAPGATDIGDVYDLIEDIYTAVGTDPTWGGLAYTTLLPRNEIIMEQEDRTIAGITISMTIEYRAARWTF
jgi:hypothetical protein